MKLIRSVQMPEYLFNFISYESIARWQPEVTQPC